LKSNTEIMKKYNAETNLTNAQLIYIYNTTVHQNAIK